MPHERLDVAADPRDSRVGRYLAAVRSGSQDPARPYLPPVGKHYPGAARHLLPWPGPGSPPPADDALSRISELLLGYAPRRVDTITSAALAALTGVPEAVRATPRLLPAWLALRRAVPSGGAFYPNEIYLAWAGSSDLPAGVYHYRPEHHCLELLRPGDPAAGLDRLLGTATAPRHALLLAHRPWKNISKYGAFGYRLSILDSGVLLGQLLTSPMAGTACLDPDPTPAADLLGLDSAVETVYATIELPATPAAGSPVARLAPLGTVPPAAGLEHDRIGLRDAHPDAIALHQAMLTDPRVPAVEPASDTDHRQTAAAVELPAATPLDLARAAARRASAANVGPGLTIEQLAGVLAHAAARATDTAASRMLARQPLYPAIWCLASQVDGIAPDAYHYEPGLHRLSPTGPTEAVDAQSALPHDVDPRMATAGAILYVVSPAGLPVAGLSPAAFHRLHLLSGVALQLAGLAGQALGAASRPLGGLTAHAVAARLGLPDGTVALAQLLLGAPAPRPGSLTAHLTKGTSDA